MLRAGIERRRDQGLDQFHQMRDRVIGALRIGDMALFALRDQRAIQRTAPADLDHIAQMVWVRRLADEAMVETLAALIGPAQKLVGAIDRRAFLIARNE